MQILPLLLLAPVLLLVGYYDLRYMRIPNALSLAALVLFLAAMPFLGWHEITLRVGLASAVFLLGFISFALGLFGGGDVKFLSVLMLFVPSQAVALYGWGFSVSMLIGVGFILTLRAAPWLEDTDWVTIRARGTFPMGISIALSGLLLPFLTTAFAAGGL